MNIKKRKVISMLYDNRTLYRNVQMDYEVLFQTTKCRYIFINKVLYINIFNILLNRIYSKCRWIRFIDNVNLSSIKSINCNQINKYLYRISFWNNLFSIRKKWLCLLMLLSWLNYLFIYYIRKYPKK
jgi:hypothetical protein